MATEGRITFELLAEPPLGTKYTETVAEDALQFATNSCLITLLVTGLEAVQRVVLEPLSVVTGQNFFSEQVAT